MEISLIFFKTFCSFKEKKNFFYHNSKRYNLCAFLYINKNVLFEKKKKG